MAEISRLRPNGPMLAIYGQFIIVAPGQNYYFFKKIG